MSKRLSVLVSIIVLLGPVGLLSAVELNVDIGCLGQEANGYLKEGWVALDGTACSGATAGVAAQNLGGTGIDAAISVGNPIDNAFRGLAGYSGDEVGRDYISADEGIAQAECAITLTLSNLPEADYTMTSYFNCPDDAILKGAVGIAVSGPGVVGTPIDATGVPQTIAANNVLLENMGQGTVQFVASGAGDVVITFAAEEEGHKWRVYLSGFALNGATLKPHMEFESSSSANLETVSPAEITVLMKNAEAGQTYTVDYAATGGTATKDVDYVMSGPCSTDFNGSGQVDSLDLGIFGDNWLSQTPGNVANVSGDARVNFVDFAVVGMQWQDVCGAGTLQFGPGQTSATIAVDIVDDGVSEDSETIELSLQNPTGPDAILGLKSEHTYTIVESEPSVGFEASDEMGREDAGTVDVVVSLNYMWSDTVTVQYAVSGGSAEAGSDYNLNPGVLTFAPGETSQTLSLSVVNDESIEETETVVITLSNPSNATLGTSEYTYSILDNEEGLMWDGTIWYYSDFFGGPFINGDGDLEWDPDKGGQFITRIPAQSLSQNGDVVEISYMWMTDGQHDCADCEDCDTYCLDDDITCIAGTSDLRVGLFEADGEYVEKDSLGTHNSIFEGYKGYNFRFGPNMQEGPNRWVDCTGEVHKTGSFAEKPESSSSLMYANEGLGDYIDGFELTPGQFSQFTVRLEKSSSRVRASITLNGRTQTSMLRGGPSKIDVLAVHMRNGRPYTRLVLRKR